MHTPNKKEGWEDRFNKLWESEIFPDGGSENYRYSYQKQVIENFFRSKLALSRQEGREDVKEEIKKLPWGQSGNRDYDRGWDDSKRAILSLSALSPEE